MQIMVTYALISQDHEGESYETGYVDGASARNISRHNLVDIQTFLNKMEEFEIERDIDMDELMKEIRDSKACEVSQGTNETMIQVHCDSCVYGIDQLFSKDDVQYTLFIQDFGPKEKIEILAAIKTHFPGLPVAA